MSNYHPEPYWSEVAERIKSRQDQNVIAGDDEPYYRYKRQRFLEMLHELDFNQKTVLELGSGPGGNLNVIKSLNTERLAGVDISDNMIALAKGNTGIEDIHKTDGKTLPFKDGEFNIVFSATVLQHNTDDGMMRNVVSEMCRVSNDQVIIFERVEDKLIGDELCMGRPVEYYASVFNDNGFSLEQTSYSNIRVSYYICGAIRKLLNKPGRKEGEAFSKIALWAEYLTLPITRILDRIFKSKKDLARLSFRKTK